MNSTITTTHSLKCASLIAHPQARDADSDIVIINTTFSSNNAVGDRNDGTDDAVADGGAISLKLQQGGSVRCSISGGEFRGNTAAGFGGAIYLNHPGV